MKKRRICLLFALILLLAVTVTAAAQTEEQTQIVLDFDAAADYGWKVNLFTAEEDGWEYDTASSFEVSPSFYRNAKWDYDCLRLTQTAGGGMAVLNFTAPAAGTYNMEITYGLGNNANYVEVLVGGTTTSYFAWANWGTAPRTITTEGLQLTKGSNAITFTTPDRVNGTSLILVKQVVFTLVEKAPESEEPVMPKADLLLDFAEDALQKRSVTDFTVEEDGWAFEAAASSGVTPLFYQNRNWDYSCLRFKQTAVGGIGVVAFDVPQSGTYEMELTYCLGNSSNHILVSVGGSEGTFFGWNNWGAEPKTMTVSNVCLLQGTNTLTFTTPSNITSVTDMMIKQISFTGTGSMELSADETVLHPGAGNTAQITAVCLDANGEEQDLSDAQITYESLNPSVVQVSSGGTVSPVGQGSGKIKVCAKLSDGSRYENIIWISVYDGKTEPTYYTKERREAALYNADNYVWAQKNRKTAVRAADAVLEYLDLYYDMIPFEGIPRTETCGMSEDPMYQNCPMCKTDLSVNYGSYGWKTDPINKPWKVTCPSCRSDFPSNDFESYYKSGLDAAGVFHPEKADKQYLVNELYLEKGEGWGVDDGWGWDTGETYTNAGGKQSKRIYAFAACYHGQFWCGTNGSGKSVDDVLNTLRDAYLYTGDLKYGRAGAILIDRVADVYPTMSLTDAVYKKPRSNISSQTVATMPAGTIPYANNHGTYYQGRILGCISESNYLAKDLIKAYDAFYPAFDDPYVLSYLSKKAKEHGLVVNGENPKDTPYELRKNGEDGLLHEISKGVRNRDIWGNFGLAQSTMAFAAIVLDTDKQLSEPVSEPLNMSTGDRRKMNTDEMIAWLFEDGPHAQKNMFNKLLTGISRDGHGDEVSPNYHLAWMRNLIDYADAMDGYTGYPGADLYKNPRFIKMLVGNLALTAGGNTTLQNGDSGSAGGIRIYADQGPIVRAYQATGNTELAQALYFLNGNTTENLAGNMFDPEAGSLADKVQAVVDAHGGYDVNRSVLLAGYGQALLKDGTKEEANQSLYGLWFGRLAGGHGNRNALDLSIFAYGLNFAPGLGYPKAADSSLVRRVWERGTVSRNTVVIDDRSQENFSYLTQYPNEQVHHFDDADTVKVMDAEGTKGYPGLAEQYRRTIVTVQGDDDASYAVDFFRVLGGSTHLYSFHAAATEYPVSDKIKTVAREGTYAGSNVEYGANVANGYSFLYDVQTDSNPANNFYLDYTITDHRKVLKNPDGLHLRLTMLSTQEEPFTEVTFAKGNPPAKDGNPTYYPYSLIRKNGGDSLFTAVYEPYRTDRYLQSMELAGVRVTDGALNEHDRVAAVKVLRTDGKTEYIVYSTNYDVTLRVDERFDFKGFVGVVTYESDAADAAICHRYGMDAVNVAGKLQPYGAVTGQVTEFTREFVFENTITVQTQQEVDPVDLAGRVIYVENDGHENGAYTIRSAWKKGSELVLELGDQSLVRSLKDSADVNGGFVYNIAQGQSFRIPLSFRTGEEEQLPKLQLAGANMTLGNDLKVNFMIKAADFQDGYTMRVTQEGREPVVLIPARYNAAYQYTAYPVAAKEMTDVLTVEVLDADGNVISEPYTKTVRDYAMGLMSNKNEKLKSVIVDMLNYGTEAQKYFGYNEDAYANALLTQAQQTSYATKDVQVQNIQQAGDNFVGASLSLESSILLNVFFKNVKPADLPGLTAKVTYTDYKGIHQEDVCDVVMYGSTRCKVIIDKVVLADAKCPVTVKLYKNGTEFGSGVESVESYVARNLAGATAQINMSIMKFASSAYSYLGGTN